MHAVSKSEQPNLLTNAVTYLNRKIETNSPFTKQTDKSKRHCKSFLIYFYPDTRATDNLLIEQPSNELKVASKQPKKMQ